MDDRSYQESIRHRFRAFMVICGVFPVVVAFIVVGIQVSMVSQLPNPAAVHWGADGVDSYGSPWTFPILTASVVLAFVLLVCVPVVVSLRRPGGASLRLRPIAAILWATFGFLFSSLTASMAVQRGLKSVDDVGPIAPWIVFGFGIGLLCGVVAWILSPSAAGQVFPSTRG